MNSKINKNKKLKKKYWKITKFSQSKLIAAQILLDNAYLNHALFARIN
jgi:hypothetical protein